MSIDLHETATTTRKAAKRARKRALKGVEAARAVDLHVPQISDLHVSDLHVPEVAKKAAKRAAKQAGKRVTKKGAKKAAKRAAKQVAKQAAKHPLPHKRQKRNGSGGHRFLRVVLITATAGALTAVAITVARRQRSQAGLPVSDTPDPFGAAVSATEGLDTEAHLRHAESPG
jgi:hypothetical protein